MAQDLLSQVSRDFKYSTDPNRADYACPAYRDMAGRWQLVSDVRAGTPVLREQKHVYLPRFEAETAKDWDARVAMTFSKDHYASTLEEHVGLVFATPPKLSKDVAPKIKDLCEDIDGEGNHLEVFAETTFDTALHFGHCVLYTDYPKAEGIKNLKDQRDVKARPYVTLYSAPDVLSWRPVSIGGVVVLAQIKFRETSTEAIGDFGVADSVTYREIKQEVVYDSVTGRPRSLGAITWRAWKEDKPGSTSDATGSVTKGGIVFTPIGEGTITGPEHIPARIVYGGQKIGFLHTKPHLLGLGYTNIEETQVSSDYANVMHKCNVPTPLFIGRDKTPSTDVVQMGQGIDMPIGGDAKFLEPAGTSIAATRQRLEDLRAHMRQQGATSADIGGKTMTAMEAGIHAKKRDAKLKRGARSLQDALEGVLADMSAFLDIKSSGPVKSGGSVTISQDFAGQTIDPNYLGVCIAAYKEGALTLAEVRHAVQTGSLPDDDDDTFYRLLADRMVDVPQEPDAPEEEPTPEPPELPAAA